MTGSEVFSLTLSLIQETDPAPYGVLPLSWLNIVLAETWETANRRREYAGESRLESIPVLTSMAQTVPYDDELVRRAFPLGLLARLYTDESDYALLDMYRREYVSAVNACDRALAVFVKE